jgi:hypothetical protein
MYKQRPKLVLFLFNIFIVIILFGVVEAISWFYLKSLWGGDIEQKISPKNLTFTPDQIRHLYGVEDITEIKKLLDVGGHPFEEDFIYHMFSDRKYRMRQIKKQTAWPPEKSRTNIFFFGGSTTLGYGVLFDQTIPSYIQELFDSKDKSNVSVYNFGESSYASIHELLLFRDILSSGFIPKMAIFTHGLNDFFAAHEIDRSTKSFGKDFLIIFEDIFKKTNLNKALNIFFGVRNSDESIKRALYNLNYQRRVIKNEFCDKLGIVCLFVHQPIPVYHFDIKKHLYINYKYKGKAKLALGLIYNGSYGYELFNRQMENNELSDLKDQILNLSKFEIDANQYVDTVHYSPKFNQAIAGEIFKFIDENKLLPK